MSKNKLGSYLSSFSNKDWIKYNSYSKTLYSETSDYQNVINYIRTRKHRYDPSYMDVEYLRKNICPEIKKEVFSKVISNLCKFIEEYITWTEVENDPMMKDTLLLQALGKRGLSTQFHKHKKKAKNNRENQPKGLWHNYHDFMAEYLLYYCNMTSDIGVSKIALNCAFENIRKFSASNMHYLVLEMNNRNVLLKEDWTKHISKFESNYKIDHGLNQINDHLIHLKVKKSEESYNYLLIQIKNSGISKEIRYTILIHTLNYLNFRIIIGDLSVKSNLSELQKYGLNQGILFPSGKIPILRFINILNTACSLKEYKWALELVENWSHLVVNRNLNEPKIIGYAQIEFSKGNFNEVIELLINAKFNLYQFELRAKWLLLCSNYELNIENYSVIEHNINAFNYYNKRNKSKMTELGYISLVNSSKFLLQITKGITLDRTIEKIKNEKNLLFRPWILTKANEKKSKARW